MLRRGAADRRHRRPRLPRPGPPRTRAVAARAHRRARGGGAARVRRTRPGPRQGARSRGADAPASRPPPSPCPPHHRHRLLGSTAFTDTHRHHRHRSTATMLRARAFGRLHMRETARGFARKAMRITLDADGNESRVYVPHEETMLICALCDDTKRPLQWLWCAPLPCPTRPVRTSSLLQRPSAASACFLLTPCGPTTPSNTARRAARSTSAARHSTRAARSSAARRRPSTACRHAAASEAPPSSPPSQRAPRRSAGPCSRSEPLLSWAGARLDELEEEVRAVPRDDGARAGQPRAARVSQGEARQAAGDWAGKGRRRRR